MNLIQQVREFLTTNKIDYLLVNSTNEFLVEYAPLEENSRFLLTNFSGSTGDALVSQKDIFLFVDGRYHEQADNEVDKNLVKVIKMKIGESFIQSLEKKIKPDKTFAIVSKKNSQSRVEAIEKILKKKNVEIRLLDFDPILKGTENGKQKTETSQIDEKITGLSSRKKLKMIQKNLEIGKAILISNLEELSYLFNVRNFTQNYSSVVKRAPEIISNSKNIETVYVDKNTINAYEYSLLGNKAAELKNNYIKEMKAIKTDAEIEHYKSCFKRTDRALFAVREYIDTNDNLSEFDIKQKLEEKFYEFGAKSLSFKPIVAKDKNSALAHYSKCSKNEVLKEGSLVLIDCGAYYEGGYATDITRVFVKGQPSKLQKKVYTTVLKAFLKAYNKKITEKTTGFMLDKTARELINTHKPNEFEFSHSLGHGIGISVHESPPSLSPSKLAKTIIKLNMCFTIEPGLYNSKCFGIRLENSCYLAKEGEKLTIKSFSNMPFEEKLIDFELLTPTEKRQLKLFKVQ